MIFKTTIKNLFSSKKHERFGMEEKTTSNTAKESFKHRKLADEDLTEENSFKLTKKNSLFVKNIKNFKKKLGFRINNQLKYT